MTSPIGSFGVVGARLREINLVQSMVSATNNDFIIQACHTYKRPLTDINNRASVSATGSWLTFQKAIVYTLTIIESSTL